LQFLKNDFEIEFANTTFLEEKFFLATNILTNTTY